MNTGPFDVVLKDSKTFFFFPNLFSLYHWIISIDLSSNYLTLCHLHSVIVPSTD